MPFPLRRAAALTALAATALACGGESAPPPQTAAAAAVTPPVATPADAAPASAALASAAEVVVYKSPTCGCCNAWVDHMREHGFAVTTHDRTDMAPVKALHGITRNLESCHTSVVDGYVIEGHVPADLIARLLTERPGIAGLAVPGMPMGSPGMEGVYKDAYDVLAFGKDGRTTVYARR